MRTPLPSFVVFAWAAWGLPAPVTAQTADLAGVVKDSSGNGIEGAQVTAVEASRNATSDAQGRFTLRGLSPGPTTIEARRIGYRSAKMVLDLPQGSPVEITLEVDAAVLPPLEVTGRSIKPARYANTTRYDDFFRRQRRGFGTFISREEIEKSNSFHTYELLRGIPGLKVSAAGGDPLSARITFPRCAGGRSSVAVFIDGVRQHPQAPVESPARAKPNPLESMLATQPDRGQGPALAEMVARISAPQIEMIEVYRGVAEIPGELNEDACAVVFIWSR